jgi:hypothetical protein
MSLNEESLGQLQTNNSPEVLGSRAIELVNDASASRDEKLDAIRAFARESLNSEFKQVLGVTVVSLYILAHTDSQTKRGPASDSASGPSSASGSGAVASMTSFQDIAEDLYGPGQGQNEETVEMVTTLFRDLTTYASSANTSTQGQ